MLQGLDSAAQWIKGSFSIASKGFNAGFGAELAAPDWNRRRAERFGSVYKRSSERTIVFYL